MVVFLSILSGLVVINVLLLIFSINGAKKTANTTLKGALKNPVKKLISQEFPEAEYKKAV